MDQLILNAWLPIFRKYAEVREPSYTAFKASFGHLFPPAQCDLPPLSVEKVARSLREVSLGVAGGRDPPWSTV